jgi:hypothetical protein
MEKTPASSFFPSEVKARVIVANTASDFELAVLKGYKCVALLSDARLRVPSFTFCHPRHAWQHSKRTRRWWQKCPALLSSNSAYSACTQGQCASTTLFWVLILELNHTFERAVHSCRPVLLLTAHLPPLRPHPLTLKGGV